MQRLPEEGYMLRIIIGESDKHEGIPLYERLIRRAKKEAAKVAHFPDFAALDIWLKQALQKAASAAQSSFVR